MLLRLSDINEEQVVMAQLNNGEGFQLSPIERKGVCLLIIDQAFKRRRDVGKKRWQSGETERIGTVECWTISFGGGGSRPRLCIMAGNACRCELSAGMEDHSGRGDTSRHYVKWNRALPRPRLGTMIPIRR